MSQLVETKSGVNLINPPRTQTYPRRNLNITEIVRILLERTLIEERSMSDRLRVAFYERSSLGCYVPHVICALEYLKKAAPAVSLELETRSHLCE